MGMLKTPQNQDPLPRQHRTGGCGELIATAMYVQAKSHLPSDVTKDQNGHRKDGVNARVAAWGDPAAENKVAGGFVIPPCADSGATFGCATFMNDQGIKPVLNPQYKQYPRSQSNPPVPPQVNRQPVSVTPGGLSIARLFPIDVLDDLMDEL